MNQIIIKQDYLRDIDRYPLSPDEHGEDVNVQPGKCNNFNYRQYESEAKYIIQHHTVCSYEKTVTTFTEGKTSAHFVIEKDGTIQGFVSPQYRAYHAGVGNVSAQSRLLDESLDYNILKDDMNSWSLGIENVNSDNEEFTAAQIKSNIMLCQTLSDKYGVNPKYMLGHSDWAIGRKIDPSPFFPWDKFAKASKLFPDEIIKDFGIYPRKDQLVLKPDPEVILSYDKFNKGKIPLEDVEHYQNLLREFAYDIPNDEVGVGRKTQDAILSYKIHFSGPEILGNDSTRQGWTDLCYDPENYGARNILSQFNENDLTCLGDVLQQL